MRLAGLVILLFVGIGCPTAATTPTSSRQAWQVEARRAPILGATAGSLGTNLPNLLIDASGDRVFLTGADGVEGLVLSTGELVFQADIQGEPIAVLPGGAVAVLDAERRLVLLDRDDGAMLFASDPTTAIVGHFVVVEYDAGKLRIRSSRLVSGNLACCAGGDYTERSEDIIDLATGEAVSTFETNRGGWGSLDGYTEVPDGINLSIDRRSIANPDGSGTLARTLEISVGDNAPWTRPMAPIPYPRPSKEAPRP